MPVGYAAGWFINRLLEGRSVAEVERGFWTIVLVLTIIFSYAFTAESLLRLWQAST